MIKEVKKISENGFMVTTMADREIEVNYDPSNEKWIDKNTCLESKSLAQICEHSDKINKLVNECNEDKNDTKEDEFKKFMNMVDKEVNVMLKGRATYKVFAKSLRGERQIATINCPVDKLEESKKEIEDMIGCKVTRTEKVEE